MCGEKDRSGSCSGSEPVEIDKGADWLVSSATALYGIDIQRIGSLKIVGRNAERLSGPHHVFFAFELLRSQINPLSGKLFQGALDSMALHVVTQVGELTPGHLEESEIRTGRVRINASADQIEQGGLAPGQSTLDLRFSLLNSETLVEKAG